MCFSGKCIWEQHEGDCGFPTNTAVRDKYPSPLCTLDQEDNPSNFEEMIEEIKQLSKQK